MVITQLRRMETDAKAYPAESAKQTLSLSPKICFEKETRAFFI